MKSKFARKVHLASTQTEFPFLPPSLLPLLSIGKFVAGNVRILLAWRQGRSVQRGRDCQVLGRCWQIPLLPADCATPQSEINFRQRTGFVLFLGRKFLPVAQINIFHRMFGSQSRPDSPAPTSYPIPSRCLFAAACKTLNISTFKRQFKVRNNVRTSG